MMKSKYLIGVFQAFNLLGIEGIEHITTCYNKNETKLVPEITIGNDDFLKIANLANIFKDKFEECNNGYFFENKICRIKTLVNKENEKIFEENLELINANLQ